MLPQIGTNIVSSFAAWMDHILLNKGQAFTNTSGLFYKQSSSKVGTGVLSTFAAPFRQFVYDNSVSGAIIPSGVTINNTFVARGTSGVAIDFLEGRVWTSGINQNAVVSGSYSVKEYNIYATTKSEQQLVFNTKYQFKPPVTQNFSGLAPDKIVAPCIFITNPNGQNKAENLGGESYRKELNIRAVVVASSNYDLTNVGSFFQDRAFSCFALLSDPIPLNLYGDYKSTPFNYIDQANAVPSNSLAYIMNVFFTKFSPSSENDVDNEAKIGFLEFEVEFSRPRDRGI